jgi:phage-related protein
MAQTAVQELVNGVIQWFTDLYNEIVGNSIIPDLVTEVLEYITTLKDDFFTLISTLVSTVLESITTFASNALSAVNTWVTNVITAATTLKDDFINRATELKDTVLENITTLKDNAEELITTAKDNLVHYFTDMKDGAVEQAEILRDDIVSFIQEIPGKIDELATQFADAGRAIVGNISDGFSGAIGAFLEEVKGKIQAIKDMLPGSEPKDHSSPLYGLSHSGRALVENFQEGINSASDIQLPFNDLALQTPQIPIPSMNAGMGMPLTGSTYTIFMDLRGSTLTESQVDAIVSKRFADLGKHLAIAGTV